mgnify:FL=1
MKSEKREGRSRFAQSLGQDKVGLLVADSGGMGYNGGKKKSPVMTGEREERMMLKPRRLYPGDRVAMVSLSWGGLGDPQFLHKYDIAKKRLKEEFQLELVPMPHALKGSDFVARHPELRAQDLMDAFRDRSIAAIFCAIGGDDTLRTLPYIDFAVMRDNPKIFMGYSDTTINHLMMQRAGLVSFYGPSVMCEFGEYVRMFDYTREAVRRLLFADSAGYVVPSSPSWSDDYVPWDEQNVHIAKRLRPETRGYELLQGSGKVQGQLMGGCVDVFCMAVGTPIWPAPKEWQGALLLLETSEEKPSPATLTYALRSLAAQGILRVVNGILVGKPQGEVYYEEYKQVLLQVVAQEEGLRHLPILYNLNIGHAFPTGVLPLGVQAEIDCEAKTLTLLESATVA